MKTGRPIEGICVIIIGFMVGFFPLMDLIKFGYTILTLVIFVSLLTILFGISLIFFGE